MLKLLLIPLICTIFTTISFADDCFTDLSTPENTLKSYIESKKMGDVSCLLKTYYNTDSFYLSGPQPIKSYKIIKKTVYTKKEADEWNRIGIIPAAKIGDVDFDVEETSFPNIIETYGYLLRKFGNEWKIIAHSQWGAPS